jgi:hypothetical protein
MEANGKQEGRAETRRHARRPRLVRSMTGEARWGNSRRLEGKLRVSSFAERRSGFRLAGHDDRTFALSERGKKRDCIDKHGYSKYRTSSLQAFPLHHHYLTLRRSSPSILPKHRPSPSLHPIHRQHANPQRHHHPTRHARLGPPLAIRLNTLGQRIGEPLPLQVTLRSSRRGQDVVRPDGRGRERDRRWLWKSKYIVGISLLGKKREETQVRPYIID